MLAEGREAASCGVQVKDVVKLLGANDGIRACIPVPTPQMRELLGLAHQARLLQQGALALFTLTKFVLHMGAGAVEHLAQGDDGGGHEDKARDANRPGGRLEIGLIRRDKQPDGQEEADQGGGGSGPPAAITGCDGDADDEN